MGYRGFLFRGSQLSYGDVNECTQPKFSRPLPPSIGSLSHLCALDGMESESNQQPFLLAACACVFMCVSRFGPVNQAHRGDSCASNDGGRVAHLLLAGKGFSFRDIIFQMSLRV